MLVVLLAAIRNPPMRFLLLPALLWWVFTAWPRRSRATSAEASSAGQGAPGPPKPEPRTSQRDHRPHTGPQWTPHEILGVSPSSSSTEIRAAYLDLVKQYHPDKVAHLAPEFRALAEARMRQINEAYARLNERR